MAARSTGTPAAKTQPETEYVPDADVSVSPEEWEWETVAEGAALRVVFDTIGDTFVGKYIGSQHVEQEPNAKGEDMSFDLFNFRGRDGELYAINQSFALVEAMANVKPQEWCRIIYIKDVETRSSKSGAHSAMKDFRVDVRR